MAFFFILQIQSMQNRLLRCMYTIVMSSHIELIHASVCCVLFKYFGTIHSFLLCISTWTPHHKYIVSRCISVELEDENSNLSGVFSLIQVNVMQKKSVYRSFQRIFVAHTDKLEQVFLFLDTDFTEVSLSQKVKFEFY